MTTPNNGPSGDLPAGDAHPALVGTPGGHTFTVRAAADACAVHPNTIRRGLKGGRFPNAYTDRAGTWRIPVSDLLAGGYAPERATPPDDPVDDEQLHDALAAMRELEAEAIALRAKMAELARRADVAEALATERAERVEDLRLALRALEARNPSPEERAAMAPRTAPERPAEAPKPTPRPRTPARRSWWQRLIG